MSTFPCISDFHDNDLLTVHHHLGPGSPSHDALRVLVSIDLPHLVPRPQSLSGRGFRYVRSLRVWQVAIKEFRLYNGEISDLKFASWTWGVHKNPSLHETQKKQIYTTFSRVYNFLNALIFNTYWEPRNRKMAQGPLTRQKNWARNRGNGRKDHIII